MRFLIVAFAFSTVAFFATVAQANYQDDMTMKMRTDGDMKYFGLGMPCLRTTTINQCQNKRVCRIVCAASPTGVGAAVCNEVCDMIPECSDIVICVQYY